MSCTIVLIHVYLKGCKLNRNCYPLGHVEAVDACTDLKCGQLGKFDADKLGIDSYISIDLIEPAKT